MEGWEKGRIAILVFESSMSHGKSWNTVAATWLVHPYAKDMRRGRLVARSFLFLSSAQKSQFIWSDFTRVKMRTWLFSEWIYVGSKSLFKGSPYRTLARLITEEKNTAISGDGTLWRWPGSQTSRCNHSRKGFPLSCSPVSSCYEGYLNNPPCLWIARWA